MDDTVLSKADLVTQLTTLNSPIDLNSSDATIVLAAGHGKRIKSETSKMLHEVWGKPTVVRVAQAAKQGLNSDNQIVVVGIKAIDVAKAVGKQTHLSFAFQGEQKGTGHAVKIALEEISGYSGNIYIFPGDMGLLSAQAVEKFKQDFINDSCDMMVLTGVFDGDLKDNSYGRILRVPESDVSGNSAGEDIGKVIEIKEHKDILSLGQQESYRVAFNGRNYSFSKDTLIELREFNTGVFVFNGVKLMHYINNLDTDNAQGELYLTDLIRIFNENQLTVKAAAAKDNSTVLGFNVKSVLKEMNNYARGNVYERLKDIITIHDQEDFYIADEVVDQIVELDKTKAPLDITIGKGVYIDKNIKLNKGVSIGHDVHLTGDVTIEEGVEIKDNVYMSTYSGQAINVGENTKIYDGVKLRGNLTLGQNCQIESFVSITGGDEDPAKIGNNVTVKGRSYIFGCVVEDDIWIEHCILICQNVERIVKRDGSVQKVRFILPMPEGLDSISDLHDPKNSKQDF